MFRCSSRRYARDIAVTAETYEIRGSCNLTEVDFESCFVDVAETEATFGRFYVSRGKSIFLVVILSNYRINSKLER